ncbi:OPA3-like protein [Solanum dulcamara]|uniref:OPA3-like protein n=1 Tax=Solanum dulcamara TaxID=45834 RepID=UPI00248523EC|nr:OPA3-like protein [Solanum dulcamara]
MVLPLLKLGTLALKTLSKPVAARLKKEAGLHPKFRNFIISIAQANHRMTTTMQRRIYGHATDVGIRPLNEEKAVQAAVDLLGEIFVFSVAGAIVVFEVQRNSRAEAKKEELRRQEMEKLRQRDEALEKEIKGLKSKIQELEQLARGKGLPGMFNFRLTHIEEGKSATAA